MKYNCERLLSECGLSGSKSKKLASALKTAIDRQDKELILSKKIKTVETVDEFIIKNKKKNKKDINEVTKREV